MECQRRLLFALWCSGVLTVTSCIRVDGYLCVNDYWYNITCVLNITGNPVGLSNATYSLKFTDLEEEGEVSCPLMVVNHSYSCACKVRDDEDTFADFSNYDIEVCDESGCRFVMKEFHPFQHIQLSPPPELVVRHSAETLNITCKSRYEDHQYLARLLKYELLLQTPQSSDSKTLHLSSPEKSVSIDRRAQLKPDAEYCIKARYMSDKSIYDGTWSEWSKPTCLKNKAGGDILSERESILVILAKSLGPVCAFVGVLLFVFYSPAARMKIKTLSRTPSPAPFFQPLYQQHKGNLQEWLSPKGKFVVTHQTEEILATDVVTVLPKPITKDPEENQDFHDSLVTQLALTQCQSSYVGLPGIHKAPPPMTVLCPGQTSYTQLPCAVWGFSIAEVEMTSSPADDFLELSHADSGCSCEDVTQSPECSLPSSPVDDSLPPCYCTDYCILNKTAEGVVPVLVSKESSVKVPSDSLQKEES